MSCRIVGMNYLERLRQANSVTKVQVSLMGALAVTLIITGVWVTTLPARFSPEKVTSSTTQSTTKTAPSSVWSGFSEAIKKQFASVFNAFEMPPELQESPMFETTATPSLVIEETPPDTVDVTTSSSSPTTTSASAPVPAMIQLIGSNATSTATTSESASPESPTSETESAPRPRVIMIATTTGSGTQTAP